MDGADVDNLYDSSPLFNAIIVDDMMTILNLQINQYIEHRPQLEAVSM